VCAEKGRSLVQLRHKQVLRSGKLELKARALFLTSLSHRSSARERERERDRRPGVSESCGNFVFV
jgi:hypothetical protein